MELLEKGYGLTETCRILGWPETKAPLLYYWKHGGVPPLAKWTVKPSRELAYTLGVLHGDGNLCKNAPKYQYRIQLAVIDKEFAITFSKVMSRLLGVNYHKPFWDNKRKAWIVYQSKAFYTWYKKTEEKSLEGFKPFIEYGKEMVKYYLRGLYDSDGGNYRNKRIYLSNSNKKLLEYVQYLLEKYFDIKSTGPYLVHKTGYTIVIKGVKYHYNQDYYAIQINRKEYVKKFLEEIGFSIIRRQLGLRKDEKPYVEGIGYIQPFKLVELRPFKLPFNQ